MIRDIDNLKDVEQFAHDLIGEGVNFHPDELFENYVNIETDLPSFTAEEAVIRNSLMEKSFVICRKQNIDIYDFMQEILLKDTGLDKYIPLPSMIDGILGT